MALAFDGILPQGTTMAHSVLTTFDPCIVSVSLASMTKSKVVRSKLSTAADGDENYRGSALVKYGDLTMTIVLDPDEDLNALLNDGNNGSLTFTLPKKDADNGTAATVVYSTAQPIGIGEANFDYGNDTDEVTIDITWMVSGYSRTAEAL
jgi:hypothetical protein